MTFNIDDGYLDGILRGFRAGLLTNADYANLTQCENLEGLLKNKKKKKLIIKRFLLVVNIIFYYFLRYEIAFSWYKLWRFSC